MPEPIFRTSEGYTPGHAAGAAEDEIITDEYDTEPPHGADDAVEPDTVPVVEGGIASVTIGADTQVVKPKRGCFRKFAYIVGVVLFFVIAALIALIYFLFFYRGADTGTF